MYFGRIDVMFAGAEIELLVLDLAGMRVTGLSSLLGAKDSPL